MLMNEPWYFSQYADNYAATPSPNPGTNFTAGASNADGASVSVLSALGFDAVALKISVCGLSLASANSNALMDILIDPAGGTSWSEFISDLVVGYIDDTFAIQAIFGTQYYFPLYIPAGASLGVRCRCAHTADITTGRVVVQAWGGVNRPEMWWYGTKVETLGVTAASSAGTSVSPDASANTWGAWTNIGSTTSHRYGAIQVGLNGPTTSAATSTNHIWQIGYGSTLLPGSDTFFGASSSNEYTTREGFGFLPIWCDIPTGTQMQGRQMSATASGQSHQLALYGVY